MRGDILTFPRNSSSRRTFVFFDSLFLTRYSNDRTNDARGIFSSYANLNKTSRLRYNLVALERTGDLISRGGGRLRSTIAATHGYCCDRSVLRNLCVPRKTPERRRRRFRRVSAIVGKSGKRACEKQDRGRVSILVSRSPRVNGDDEVPIQGGAPVREEEGRGREDPTEISGSSACEYKRAAFFCVSMGDENRLQEAGISTRCIISKVRERISDTSVERSRTIQSCFPGPEGVQGRVYSASYLPIFRRRCITFRDSKILFYLRREITRFMLSRVPFSCILPSTRIDLFYVCM